MNKDSDRQLSATESYCGSDSITKELELDGSYSMCIGGKELYETYVDGISTDDINIAGSSVSRRMYVESLIYRFNTCISTAVAAGPNVVLVRDKERSCEYEVEYLDNDLFTLQYYKTSGAAKEAGILIIKEMALTKL